MSSATHPARFDFPDAEVPRRKRIGFGVILVTGQHRDESGRDAAITAGRVEEVEE
jgi:hypothetical protein